MLTRRLPTFSALVCGLSTVLMFNSACVTLVDDEAGDGNGDGDTDGDADTNTDTNTDTNNDTDNDTSAPELCEEACVNLEECGFPTDECLLACFGEACATCLANSDSCGQDCIAACSGDPTGDGDGDGDPTGDGDPSTGDGDGDVPAKDCVINDDCGISFECVSCGLTDSEGWCEQSQDCTFNEDCGFGGYCGYNVETSDYRCLPAEYCQ